MFSEEYKKSLDFFVEENCTISAEDIMAKAMDEKVVEFSKPKQSKGKKLFILLVACITILAMSTVAFAASGYGPLAKWFRDTYDDEVAAEIVEEGYIYEINQSKSSADGKFTVNLVAVTGDTANPVVAMDIEVNDEKFVETYDSFKVFAYILETYEYENEKSDYSPWDAEAKRDDKQRNLYHVAMRGPAVWLTRGEEVIIDICEIIADFDSDNPTNTLLLTDIEFKITPPQTSYHPVIQISRAWVDYFLQGDIKYFFTRAEFGEYESLVHFSYNYLSSSIAGGKTEYDDIAFELNDNWVKLANNIVLVVDGKEYLPLEDGIGWADCYDKQKKNCIVWMAFPEIDYEGATEVLLKNGDETIQIK